MRNITEEIKTKTNGVKVMLEKLSVSNPELVKKLKSRKYSSRGDGSGCENTQFTSVWDSWGDKK
jgi:hypothetical protein